jgi:hypothetical protein
MPDSSALVETSTCEPFGFSCQTSCEDSAQGNAAVPAGFALGGELVIARLSTVIKRSYNIENKGCFEHGCICEKTLVDDSSQSELVLTRFDTTSETFTELGRYPTAAVTSARLYAANSGDFAALLWSSPAGVELAELSLAKVAKLP